MATLSALPSSAAIPFTPELVNVSLCLARVWADGFGGQCCRTPLDVRGGFCHQHMKDDAWRRHGRVDGPVPQRKLLDFQKAAAQRSAGTHQRAAVQQAKHAVEHVDIDAEDAGSESGSEAEFDPEVQGTLDLTRPLLFGSGAVIGAEAVAAHTRRRASVLPSAPGGPSEPSFTRPDQIKRNLERSLSDEKEPDPKRTARRRELRPLMEIVKRNDNVDSDAKHKGSANCSKSYPPQYELVIGKAISPQSQQDLEPWFQRFDVPQAGQELLLPMMDRWGCGRVEQLLWLWTFLGDGRKKPVSARSLHLWGLPGTGKTGILFDFLDTLVIRSIWLDCACFFELGELLARVVELLRKTAVEASNCNDVPEIPAPLRHRMPPGKQLRALDKLEAAVRPILEYLLACGQRKCVIVLDHAQELARLGAGAAELVTSLPEKLQLGDQLSIVTVGRLPLSTVGLTNSARDAPTVTFQAYTEAQAESVLLRELSSCCTSPELKKEIGTIVKSGLMKFANQLGRGIHDLLGVGRAVLRDDDQRLGGAVGTGSFITLLQLRVQEAVELHHGIGDLRGLCEAMTQSGGGNFDSFTAGGLPASAAAVAEITLKHMTKAEMRLVLSSYLASHINKDDDMQLFMPGKSRKHFRRGGRVVRKPKNDLPTFARPPRPATLVRVIAISHVLARQPQMLGTRLFENVSRLREARLLRVDRASKEHEARVVCLAELPLIRACARELNIDLAEYLCE